MGGLDLKTNIRILFLLFLQAFASNALADDIIDKIKTSYVYNILQFVSFPASNIDQRIKVCVVGKSSTAETMREINNQTTPQGTISVALVEDNANLTNCNVVYFTLNSNSVKTKLLSLDRDNVLTIGETTNFLDNGGLIAFYDAEDKIRFKINKKKVFETKYKLSSQLISLGTN